MKKIIVFTVTIFALTACNSSTTKNETTTNSQTFDTTTLAKGQEFYQCEMDLEIISNKPGNCNKCGMELQKIVKQ